MEKQNAALLNKHGSAAFYDARYLGHYMEEWPESAKARVREVIQLLDLPRNGQALDFGCGSGVMTEVLRQALGSEWTVFGCDVSGVAIFQGRRALPALHLFSD
jgi:ubiquinone/menaquinone biosynthesis C-methylase UbiE